MILSETVGNPNEVMHVKPGFEIFFEKIMNLVRDKELHAEIGDELRRLALTFPSYYDMQQFDIVSDKDYERTLIGRDDSGWEALIMTWRKGRQSSIHGHPQFAAYNILKGKLKLEVFEETNNNGEIKLSKELETDEGTVFYAIGEANIMTNHIHRISCLSDISYSLHIYSDDARKGVTYSL